MFELIFAIGAIAGIGSLAKQRGGRLWLWSTLTAVGFTLAALTVAGPLAIAVRWAPLGLVYVAMLLATRRRVKLEHVWQCQDCQMFNDPSMYICLCGYENPEATATG